MPAVTLENEAGDPEALTAVEIGVSFGGACQRIPATFDGEVWSFDPAGIPAGLHRSQVWWDDGSGFSTDGTAYFGLNILRGC